MFVTECSIGMHNMTPESAQDEIKDGKAGPKYNAIAQLRSVAGLCNSGEFDAATLNLPIQERKIIGDATDQAVLRFSETLGPVSELREMWIKTFELAFNSKNKYMIRTFELARKEGLDLALPKGEATAFQHEDT